jgi:hypothetical protein
VGKIPILTLNSIIHPKLKVDLVDGYVIIVGKGDTYDPSVTSCTGTLIITNNQKMFLEM